MQGDIEDSNEFQESNQYYPDDVPIDWFETFKYGSRVTCVNLDAYGPPDMGPADLEQSLLLELRRTPEPMWNDAEGG